MNSKITPLQAGRGIFLARTFSMTGLLTAFIVSAACHCVVAATLESQWRRLPEVSVKPESGASAKKSPLAGGNGWQESAQEPDSVPVQFYVYFKSSESVVTATLAGQSAHEEDPYSDEDPDNVFIQSEPATANLQPNRTYTLTLSGADVYSAEVHLAAPSLYDIFQTATVGKQPARLYNVYFFSPDDQKWEKVCPYRFPHSPSMDTWQSINLTFQVQVRPDLGARPVTRPGQRAIGPEDQPDDAWTREEPAIDAQTAPGDGEPVTLASSKQGDPASARFTWAAYLGRLWSGAGAGRITLDQWRLDTNAYTPVGLSYVPRSDDTNEVAVAMDLDNTNCLSQVRAPQALANLDPLYGSPLLLTNEVLLLSSLVHKLTATNRDPVSQYLFTNFTSTGQQVLLNTNSSGSQLLTTVQSEFNRIMQGSSIYNAGRFGSVSLAGRTRRLLLVNPSGNLLARLNRFLMEDAYAAEAGEAPIHRVRSGLLCARVCGAARHAGLLHAALGRQPVCLLAPRPAGGHNQPVARAGNPQWRHQYEPVGVQSGQPNLDPDAGRRQRRPGRDPHGRHQHRPGNQLLD